MSDNRQAAENFCCVTLGSGMKKAVVLITCVAAVGLHAPTAMAATSELTLQIRSKDGKPLPGVQVAFFDDDHPTCTTDALGLCRRKTDLPHLDFKASKEGFAPVSVRFAWRNDRNVVEQTMLSDAEQAALDRQAREVEQAREAQKLQADKQRIQLENAKRDLRLDTVRTMNDIAICAGKGAILRGEALPFPTLTEAERDAINVEFSKRKLKLDLKQTMKQQFSIGSSECTMAGAYGNPSASNRSVGPWGTRVQHVYAELHTYVYTRNGRVESWQD